MTGATIAHFFIHMQQRNVGKIETAATPKKAVMQQVKMSC